RARSCIPRLHLRVSRARRKYLPANELKPCGRLSSEDKQIAVVKAPDRQKRALERKPNEGLPQDDARVGEKEDVVRDVVHLFPLRLRIYGVQSVEAKNQVALSAKQIAIHPVQLIVRH